LLQNPASVIHNPPAGGVAYAFVDSDSIAAGRRLVGCKLRPLSVKVTCEAVDSDRRARKFADARRGLLVGPNHLNKTLAAVELHTYPLLVAVP
jgi:hypothetical protein